MRKLSYTFALLMIVVVSNHSALNAQINWSWAATGGKGISQYSYSAINRICFDGNNNSYVAGCISTPALVGTLTPSGYGNSDIVIIKYDMYGNPIWATTAGGAGNDVVWSMVLDGDGHLYIAGFFSGAATFGSIVVNNFASSFFVAKLDTSGNFIWVRDGSNLMSVADLYNPVIALALDSSDHVYVAGFTRVNMQLIDTMYNSPGYNTMFFIEQLDTAGSLLNAYFKKSTSSGFGNTTSGVDLVADQNGDIIYATSFPRVDTVINGPNSITPYDNLIIGKLNSSGVRIWEKEYGDTAHYVWGANPRGLTLDAAGNIYVSGYYYKTLYLQPGPAGNGGYTCKVNPANGNVIYARQFNAANYSIPMFYGADYTFNGHVRYCGAFCGTVDFGGIISSPISSVYDCDDFIVQYDTAGTLDWVVRLGYYNYDFIRGAAAASTISAYGGTFKDSLTIGTQTLYADTMTTNSDFFFVAVEGSEPDDVITLPGSGLSFGIAPNPATDYLQIETSDPLSDYIIEIYAADGTLISLYTNFSGPVLDISFIAAGNYFVTLRNDRVSVSKRFVKI